MEKLNVIAFFSLFLFLSACGGGSSSGGGQTNDGVFSGSAEFTLSAEGESETQIVPIGFVIQNNVITNFTLGDEMTEPSVALTGNSFSVSGSQDMAITTDGVSCITPILTLSGTVAGDTITGNLSGAIECTVSGETITVEVSGAFTATRG